MWRRRLLPAVGILAALGDMGGGRLHLQGAALRGAVAVAVFATLTSKFGLLMDNLLPTAIEAFCGFLLGNAAAIIIATMFVHKKILEEAFFPLVVIINTIPVVAKAPILVLLLGNGMEPKIAIAALICFFPTLVNMVRGLESVNPQAMELMRVLSASKTEVFFKLRLLQLAALSVLRPEDLGLDLGHRRDRRRVDRLHAGHRSADHPGHIRLRFRAALRDGHRRLRASPWSSSWRSRWPSGWSCAGRRPRATEPSAASRPSRTHHGTREGGPDVDNRPNRGKARLRPHRGALRRRGRGRRAGRFRGRTSRRSARAAR